MNTTGEETQKPGSEGYANGDQPSWAPPESQPEPRPADPILDTPPAEFTAVTDGASGNDSGRQPSATEAQI